MIKFLRWLRSPEGVAALALSVALLVCLIAAHVAVFTAELSASGKAAWVAGIWAAIAFGALFVWADY